MEKDSPFNNWTPTMTKQNFDSYIISYMWNMKESVAIETLYRMEIDPQT